MEGGAASAQDNPLNGAEVAIAHVESAKLGGSLLVGETPAHGVGDTAHLIVDLLKHVVGVLSLVDILVTHVDGGDIVSGAGSINRGEDESFARNSCNLVIVEVDDVACVADDCTHVAGQKMLSFADTEHQGTAASGPDDKPRKLRMNDRDAVGSLDLSQRLSHCGNQGPLSTLGRAVKSTANQLSKSLRIGLGDEGVPLFLKLSPEFRVVLNDPVVDEGQFS